MRRVRQRRQIQIMIAASYMRRCAWSCCSMPMPARSRSPSARPSPSPASPRSLFYLVLSETGFIERFKDHYFVVPQLFISTAIMLAFTYVAPEVGVMFLCTLFTVFNFGSLRSTPWQTALAWTVDDRRPRLAVSVDRQADRPAA